MTESPGELDVKTAQVQLLEEYDGHRSVRRLVADGAEQVRRQAT